MADFRNYAKAMASGVLRRSGLQLRRVSKHNRHDRICDIALPHHSTPRVIVNTTPKAGTYLFASIVEELGFHHSHLHLGDEKLQAYDRNLLDEGLRNPRLFDVHLPLSESRNLVRSGELAVGHLAYSPEREREFSQFKMILVMREVRASLISFARMLAFSGKSGSEIATKIKREGVAPFLELRGKARLQQIEKIVAWRDCPQVCLLKFEDLAENPSAVVEKIAKFLNLSGIEPNSVYEKACNKATLTKGEKYPQVIWDDRAERLFTELGGRELNSKLGYRTDTKHS